MLCIVNNKYGSTHNLTSWCY